MSWAPVNRFGTAEHAFVATPDTHEISVHVGERLHVLAESENGWYKGRVSGQQQFGVFPKAYVQLSEESTPKRSASSGAETPRVDAVSEGGSLLPEVSRSPSMSVIAPTPGAESSVQEDISNEALMQEVKTTVTEWSSQLASAMASGDTSSYERLLEQQAALLDLRRALNATLDARLTGGAKSKDSTAETTALRAEIRQLIEATRKTQSGYMITRTSGGEVADVDNCSGVSLLDLYRAAASEMKEDFSELWQRRAQTRMSDALVDALAAEAKRSGKRGSGQSEQPVGVFPRGLLQLFLDIKMCIFKVGEDTELLFWLYSRDRKSFITEPYVLQNTSSGMPVNPDLYGRMWTMFQDLSKEDFESDLYLVAHIFRKGCLNAKDIGSKKNEAEYKRPFGCAVMSLSRVGLENKLGQEVTPDTHAMPIYCCSDSQFDKIHEMIIDKDKSLQQAALAKGIAVGVYLLPGTVREVTAAQERYKLELDDVCLTRCVSFPRMLSADDKRDDFYLWLLLANILKDGKKADKNVQVLMHVRDRKGRSIPNCIIAGSGCEPQSEYKSCVYYHWNQPCYNECVRISLPPAQFPTAHVFLTFWHASTKVKKTNVFSWAYIPLCGKSGGAVRPDGETRLQTFKYFTGCEESDVVDPFYLEGSVSNAEYDSKSSDMDTRMVPRKEWVSIRTKLVSTRQTQNEVLHHVFGWKHLDADHLKTVFDQFMQMDSESMRELGKFLPETFNCFFGILDKDEFKAVHQHAFKAVVHALALVVAADEPMYLTVLTQYLGKVFRYSNPRQLLKLFAVSFMFAVGEGSSFLVELCRALEFFVRFVLAAYSNDARSKSPTLSADGLREQLTSLLQQINQFLASPLGSQSAVHGTVRVLRGLPTILTLLSKVFGWQALGRFARSTVNILFAQELKSGGDSAQPVSPEEGKEEYKVEHGPSLRVERLFFLYALVTSSVGVQTEARVGFVNLLVCAVNARMGQHMDQVTAGDLDELYMALACVRGLLNTWTSHDEFSALVPLLQSLVDTVLAVQQCCAGSELAAVNRDIDWLGVAPCVGRHVDAQVRPAAGLPDGGLVSESVRELVQIELLTDAHTVLLTVLRGLTKGDWERMHNTHTDNSSSLFSFYARVLAALARLQHLSVFPKLWATMHVFQHSAIHRALTHVGSLLARKWAKPDRQAPDGAVLEQQALTLFTVYFRLTIRVLLSPAVSLETFSTAKREYVLDKYGDLRDGLVKDLMGPVWAAVDSRLQYGMTDMLVYGIFEMLSGSAHAGTQEQARRMFADQLVAEFDINASLSVVERCSVDSLYDIAHLTHGRAGDSDDSAGQSASSSSEGKDGGGFMSGLVTHVNERLDAEAKERGSAPAEPLRLAARTFLSHLSHIYELMASLLRFPTTAEYETERTQVALRMISYLDSIGDMRKEIYVKYVQYLVDLHLEMQNYVEAGVTQLQHISLYDWRSHALVPAAGPFVEEKEYVRKIKLYESAIRYFEKGEDYERAAGCVDQLRSFFQNMEYDYKRVADLCQKQSELFQRILSGERFYSYYFRVCFYGRGFEKSGDVGEFVYRGNRLEPIMDFSNRLKRKYPGAKLHMSSDEPSEDMLAKHDQIISVTTLLKPSVEERDAFLRRWCLTTEEGKAYMEEARKQATPPGQPARLSADQNCAQLERLLALSTEKLSQVQEYERAQAHVKIGGALGRPAGRDELKNGTQPQGLLARLGVLGEAGGMTGVSGVKRPDPVVKYSHQNDLQVFQYNKADQRAKEKKPANEFKDLWVVQNFIIIRNAFPYNRRRTDIVGQVRQMMRPIENAIVTVTEKTEDLKVKIDVVRKAPPGPVDVGPLSMNLNGVIDAAVNGGSQKFISAFLTPEYLERQESGTEHLMLQEALKAALRGQIAVLKDGLQVFGSRCDPKLQGLYDHLTNFFKTMVEKTRSVLQ